MTSDWRGLPIAVVGCGGLGVPAAWTLAYAGARHLRLIDGDVVETSNLHRQVLYREQQIGQRKVDALKAALRRRFPTLTVEVCVEPFTPDNLEQTLAGCIAVVEGTDDAHCKFLVNDVVVRGRDADFNLPRVAVIAAAIGRRAQWFTLTERSACYRCLFEEPPPVESLATCDTAGVLGPVVGVGGGAAARALVDTLDGATEADKAALIQRQKGRWRSTMVRPAEDCLCAATRSVTSVDV